MMAPIFQQTNKKQTVLEDVWAFLKWLLICYSSRSTRNSAEPVKRLWRTLVHQEAIQEIFIHNIFKREIETSQEVCDVGFTVGGRYPYYAWPLLW